MSVVWGMANVTLLSTDTKPMKTPGNADLLVGFQCREWDTGRQFYWTGSAWQDSSRVGHVILDCGIVQR